MQQYTAGREEVNCLFPMAHRGEETSVFLQGFFILDYLRRNKENKTKKSCPNSADIYVMSHMCTIIKNTRHKSFTEIFSLHQRSIQCSLSNLHLYIVSEEQIQVIVLTYTVARQNTTEENLRLSLPTDRKDTSDATFNIVSYINNVTQNVLEIFV